MRLRTTKGDIVIAIQRDLAPIGVDRFHELVRIGYYDDVAFSRVIANKWAQFGINGDPKVSTAWRTRTIPDDPFRNESNVRGTVAFAFAVPNGRTTQVFINLADNSATHDREPFVVFGRVSRLRRRHTSIDQLLRFALDMERQFVVQIAVRPAGREQGAKTKREIAKGDHGVRRTLSLDLGTSEHVPLMSAVDTIRLGMRRAR